MSLGSPFLVLQINFVTAFNIRTSPNFLIVSVLLECDKWHTGCLEMQTVVISLTLSYYVLNRLN